MGNTSLTILVLFFAVTTGCVNSTEKDTIDKVNNTIMYELDPRLVLGQNEYDEYNSFSTISAVRFLSDGRIAVLDRYIGGARVYSPSGEYLTTIGRLGQGPGEFTSPSSLASSTNKLIIVDIRCNKATLLDQEGNYISELSETYSVVLPNFIHFVNDSIILGGITTLDASSESYDDMIYLVATMDMNLNLLDTLYANPFVYEPGNATQFLQETLFSGSHATDGMGNVFTAISSPEVYLIDGYNCDGENFMSITRQFEPVEKDEEDYNREQNRITRMIQARNPGVNSEYTPLRMVNLIPPNGVHVDGLGRIWVLRGVSREPLFDVYDYTGELLFSARITGIDPDEPQEVLWWTVSKYGMAVFSRDPYEVPLVWIFDFPGQT